MKMSSVFLLVIGVSLAGARLAYNSYTTEPIRRSEPEQCRIVGAVVQLRCPGEVRMLPDEHVFIRFLVRPKKQLRPLVDGDTVSCRKNVRSFFWTVQRVDNELHCVSYDWLEHLEARHTQPSFALISLPTPFL